MRVHAASSEFYVTRVGYHQVEAITLSSGVTDCPELLPALTPDGISIASPGSGTRMHLKFEISS